MSMPYIGRRSFLQFYAPQKGMCMCKVSMPYIGRRSFLLMVALLIFVGYVIGVNALYRAAFISTQKAISGVTRAP